MSQIPKHQQQVAQDLGEAPIHESPNTIGWLEDMEQAAIKKRNHETVKYVWAVVFSMPKNAAAVWRHNEIMADRDEELEVRLHVHTESVQDLQARTVHVADIPADHIVLSKEKDPTLSLDLMDCLNQFGDVDTVTVRVKPRLDKDGSWALVTFESQPDAAAAVEAGLSVRVTKDTEVLDHKLRVTAAQLELQSKDTVQYKQVHKHTRSEALFRAMPITHECWSFCQKCLASDIEISHHVTANRSKIIISLGATMDSLVQQAVEDRTVMRMAETKGTMFFHPDLLHFYAANHGGLNECVVENQTTKWVPRNPALASEWASRPPRDPSGKNVWEDLNDRSLRVFTSAHAQALVMQRLKSRACVDPEQNRHCSDARTMMKVMKSRVCRKKQHKVTAEMCHDLLLSHGGFRPHSRDVFPKVGGAPVVALLADACHKDPMWTLYPDGHVFTSILSPGSPDYPTYNLIIDVLRVFEAWSETVGREEVFVGTLQHCFPVHDATELSYLKRDWARFSILFHKQLLGFEPEGDPEAFRATKNFANNTFGSDANAPRLYTWPAVMFYQPLEEIHDYFGSDIGLYFAWLDKYTHMLFLMSFYGTFVMVKQLLYHDGPDDNPLTLVYSIYVGAWSIVFLQAWNRRETELRFLWGLDRRKDIDNTRREFKYGPNVALNVNPDTGRQTYVVRNATTQFWRKMISALCVLGMMLFAMVSATMAILVRYLAEDLIDPESDIFIAHGNNTENLPDYDKESHYKYDQTAELASAFLGLFVIIICGMIFDGVAMKLNEYENHRTQDEFDDSLILKTFAFQFLNNYWALIYIAYFREVPDPFFKQVHPCEDGSCMLELQFQLLIVFSFKTVGKQFGFTIRPFIFKAFKLLLANRQFKRALGSTKHTLRELEHTLEELPGGKKAAEITAQVSLSFSLSLSLPLSFLN